MHDQILNLCLRRGIVFPSSELYDSPAGFWEYGHYGAAMKRRLCGLWRNMVVKRSDMVEIDGSVIMAKDVFQASGHLEGFSDPLVECTKCKNMFRADKLVADKTRKEVPENLGAEEFDKLLKTHGIKCPGCKSALGVTRKFNMMIKIDIGATNPRECYLRPETCQSIFVDFPRLFKTIKRKLPLGIAQVGRSFRNEISPRNSLLRMREFTQAEAEVFFNPKDAEARNFEEVKDYELNLKALGEKKDFVRITVEDAVRKKIISNKLFAYNLAIMQQFFVACGLPIEKLRMRELDDKERAFYAKESWDTEFSSSLGWIELVANNYRSDYDMGSHGKVSGKDVAVFEDNEKIVPHVWEISMGVDRTFFCMLESAYREENKRVYLRIPPRLAPADASIFPLIDKDGLAKKSEEIFKELKDEFDVELEIKDSIGKRYARADEVGIPLCITVDYQTLKDDTVTLRNRDDTKQIRVSAGNLSETIRKFLSGESFEKLPNRL